jgi:uncharacterized protein
LKRKLSIAVLTLVVLGLAMSWLVGTVLSRSTNGRVLDAVAPAVDIALTSQDGLHLAGTYRPGVAEDGPAILLLHGNGSSRASAVDTAEWLHQQGYATLAIDFRGHGESDEANHSFGLFEARDARAAFNWLKKKQAGAPIGVIGISLGGAAALLGDDGPLPADAMILQAVYPDIRAAIRNRLSAILGTILGTVGEPFLSYQSLFRQGEWPARLSPIRAAAKLRSPTLVIGGGEDQYTPPVETRAMFDAIKAPKEVWVVPGLSHAGISGEQNAPYRARVEGFLLRYLKKG